MTDTPTQPPSDDAWESGLSFAFGSDSVDESENASRALLESSRIKIPGLSLPSDDVDEDDAVGFRLGRYLVESELARGGVGVVYRGRDLDLERPVAIKILRRSFAGETELLRRFVEEAQIAGQLQHPGIVPVYDFGLDARHRPWFAMPLVEGQTLAERLAARGDDARARIRHVECLRDVARALAFAHERGVIHRDVKPANVIVGATGEVRLMDWGFAKVIGDKDAVVPETIRSQSEVGDSIVGSVMGTPSYMAPEQARGETDVLDARVDVFSLGAILAQVITGHAPYEGELGDVLDAAKNAQLATSTRRLEAADVEPELRDLALASLSPMPSDRPKDAGVIARALDEFLEESAIRVERLEAARRRERESLVAQKRNRRLGAVISLLLIALAIAGVFFGLTRQRDRERARDAVANALEKAESRSARREWIGARDALDRVAFRQATAAQTTRRDTIAQDIERGRKQDRLVEILREGTASRSVEVLQRSLGVFAWPKDSSAMAKVLPRDLAGDPRAQALLVRALDEWSLIEPKQAQRFKVVLDEIDSDPLRREIRARSWKGTDLTTRIINSDRADAQAWDLASGILMSEDASGQGLNFLSDALVEFPDDYWLNLRMARALESVSPFPYEEAQRHAMVAFMAEPKSRSTKNLLARIHAKAGANDRVRALAKVRSSRSPEDLEEGARFFRDLGMIDDERRVLREILDRRPQDGFARDRLRQIDSGGPRGVRRPGRGERRNGRPGPLDRQRFEELEQRHLLGEAIGPRDKVDLIRGFLDVGQSQQAYECLDFEAALPRGPARRRALNLMLRIALESGHWDACLRLGKKIERPDPRSDELVKLARQHLACFRRFEAGDDADTLMAAFDSQMLFSALRQKGAAKRAIEIAKKGKLMMTFADSRSDRDLRHLAAVALKVDPVFADEVLGAYVSLLTLESSSLSRNRRKVAASQWLLDRRLIVDPKKVTQPFSEVHMDVVRKVAGQGDD